MQKISIVLTLAWLVIVFTVPPRAAYAERVLCGTPMECYEKAMAKLQKALDIVEAQRVENERLRRKVAELEIVDLSRLEGRNYYLLEKNFTCRANAPGKPILKSWKDRIGFSNGKVLIWGTVCNDNPIINTFNYLDFSLSDDMSSLKYQAKNYTFYEEKPKLCPSGQWCPINEENM